MHQSTIMDQSSIMPAQGTSALGVLTPALTPHAPSSSYENGMSAGGILHPNTMMTPASSSLQRTALFGGGGGSAIPNGGGGGGGGGLFQTPNLTPIATEQSFAMGAPPAGVPPTTHRAVQRARKVAFRDYYEPSPEARTATNTSGVSHGKPRSLFWSGLDASAAAGDASMETTDQQKQVPQSAHKTLFGASETKSHIGSSSFAKQPPLSSIKAPRSEAQSNYAQPQEEQGDSVQTVLRMLVLLGTAQVHLGQFRSKKAIQVYQKLPDEHYHTGWVLHQVGRAYFAMADYQNAIRSLQVMEQVEPHRMAGLEVLSTALWQMKREVELSHLAQRVTDFDRLSAEVWCVVGNCFSLQKEHETALTFFRRSIQLDPSFTYSHTLSGHEYFANEDFDKAVACYRDAIRADERHYNAWYGMGAVYYRQEKFDLAEYHFHRACSINPQSSVLICHLGMAQNANGKPYEALDTLQAAFRLDPHNPQAHYQRALVYQALDRHEEALLELERVRDAAPREAQIHFSMGRLYKRMGRTERAMRCFLDALDLDPKDTNLIKAAIEKMDEPDVEEEISAF
jgi:anaphase-promoting complex subunit 3